MSHSEPATTQGSNLRDSYAEHWNGLCVPFPSQAMKGNRWVLGHERQLSQASLFRFCLSKDVCILEQQQCGETNALPSDIRPWDQLRYTLRQHAGASPHVAMAIAFGSVVGAQYTMLQHNSSVDQGAHGIG